VRPELDWQPSLLDGRDADAAGGPRVDTSYSRLRRIDLDAQSWIDFCPGWLAGSDLIFEELLASARWQQRVSTVYDRTGPEPRLTAGWDTDTTAAERGGAAGEPAPPLLAELAAALSQRYDVAFDRVWVNLYRDGNDSVAWHRDRNHRVMSRPLVATVSLGGRRRFQLRRRGTTRIACTLEPGPGDLVVMGGQCQRDWEHTVPKTRQPVGPRMSVTIRHSQPAPGERWLSDPRGTEPGQAW
jgi:alkylated DNA repair dioxygenase AlkB